MGTIYLRWMYDVSEQEKALFSPHTCFGGLDYAFLEFQSSQKSSTILVRAIINCGVADYLAHLDMVHSRVTGSRDDQFQLLLSCVLLSMSSMTSYAVQRAIDFHISDSLSLCRNDYEERFDFHCTALGIRKEWQKALFKSCIGREAFSKVKMLASPTPLTNVNLLQIVNYISEATLQQEFKHDQQEKETLADYLAELRKIAKTCNFGGYLDLEAVLHDQLMCGLCDQKTQKELLCISGLTIIVATDRAKAVEAINQKAKQMNPDPVSTPTEQINKTDNGVSYIGVTNKAIQVPIIFRKTSTATIARRWVTLALYAQ